MITPSFIHSFIHSFIYHMQTFGLHTFTRCSAIAERPRCRVRYSFGQKWKTGSGRQYLTDTIGLSSTTVT